MTINWDENAEAEFVEAAVYFERKHEEKRHHPV
jgi:hypothetical protein